jgi:hypothetical protein
MQTWLGPTQPSAQLLPQSLSLEIKGLGLEADHSPISAEVKKEWIRSPSSPYFSIQLFLIASLRPKDSFNFMKHKHSAYKRKNEERSRGHFCRGKAISITYSECVSMALFIQNAKRMRRVVLSFVPVRLYHIFPHSHKRQDFRKNVIEHKMCALIFSTIFV